jgi:hypothetical protein
MLLIAYIYERVTVEFGFVNEEVEIECKKSINHTSLDLEVIAIVK